MRRLRSLPLLLTSTVILCSFGIQDVSPSDFVLSEIPVVGSDEWSQLNRSDDEFNVTMANGQLRISEFRDTRTTEFQLPHGKLVGTDRGEWGGQLLFRPADQSGKSFVLANGNIKSIFSLNDTIYYLEGLAHLSLDHGSLNKIDTTGGEFKLTKVMDLGDSPLASTVTHDTLMIASHNRFYLINHYHMEVLVDSAFWYALYPNSICERSANAVFIGMRGGYAELNSVNKGLKFYKYKSR